MTAIKRVLLVDDHHLVRAGLRALLEDTSGYEVVAEGADGSEVIGLVEAHSPDILIMDIAMQRVSGLEALPGIKKRFPELYVILLSMHSSRDFIQQAFDGGADAYLLKDSAEVELELALAAVARNERYLSPRISDFLIDVLSGKTKPETKATEVESILTSRQIEILRLIALGKGTKEIAFDLDLSVKTVESHRAQIMERLNIRDIASLVRYALKQGVISLDDEI